MSGVAPETKPKGIILNFSSAFVLYKKSGGRAFVFPNGQPFVTSWLSITALLSTLQFGIHILIERDKPKFIPKYKNTFYCDFNFVITFCWLISSNRVYFHYPAPFTAFARHFGCKSPCLLLRIGRLTYSIVNVLPLIFRYFCTTQQWAIRLFYAVFSD